MPHEINRVLAAVNTAQWFIEPDKAAAILAMLEMRAAAGQMALDDDDVRAQKAAIGSQIAVGSGVIHVLRLHGTVMPRANMLSNFSGGTSMVRFQEAFAQAANDPRTTAIVLDVDSPGGAADLVPETAAMIRAARRPDRPIVAVANTLAASAAYWLASAADEIVVTPSGQVGSVGVYVLHQDVSERLKKDGIKPTFIHEGARKVERNPFGPLDEPARAHLQSAIRDTYDMFTNDVAKARGVPVSTVRADPEDGGEHFGGGRVYGAKQAVKLKMADRVATLSETVQRLAKPRARNPRIAALRLKMT